VTALLAAARTGQFDHVARLARDNRALTEQAAEITDELRCAGVAVLDTAPRDHRLDSLRTPEGDPPTPENHHDCPGHAAVVETAHGYVDPVTRRPADDAEVWDDEGDSLSEDGDHPDRSGHA